MYTTAWKDGNSTLPHNRSDKFPNHLLVLITEKLPLFREEYEILSKVADVKVASDLSEQALINDIADASILMVVYARITRKIIEAGKSLRGIVRYGIGVDNIDLVAATELGVPVANIPDYAIDSVAEHTFSLILGLSRKIVTAHNVVKNGSWKSWTSPSESCLGVELQGKALGLIGLGKIARAVAFRARAFGMDLWAYDPYVTEQEASSLWVSMKDLNSLLSQSDFISLHAPLTDATRGIISYEQFRMMKRSANVINTSRGPLIDKVGLLRALDENLIAGVALDVFPEEPPDRNDPLLGYEQVLFTPHIAWFTKEARVRLEMSAVELAMGFLTGNTPKTVVNPAALNMVRR